mgnify:CR=1 FL=1
MTGEWWHREKMGLYLVRVSLSPANDMVRGDKGVDLATMRVQTGWLIGRYFPTPCDHGGCYNRACLISN